ncbi:peptidase S1 [Halobacteriales archaeon QS_6_64_34]|nr:MAG: peptidase S1 [Halobacteriales archaeon QS_6_64_34]
MDSFDAGLSRREALGALSGALTVGLGGCTGGGDDDSTPTASSTAPSTDTVTPTPTAPMDPPNIERQTVLRDKAAIPHIRWTVSGTIETPEPKFYNRVDTSLLGRWEREGQVFEFKDDLTFTENSSDRVLDGTYYTVPPKKYLEITHDDGDTYKYYYEVTTAGDTPTIDFYNTNREFLASYEQTVDGQDNRTVVEAAKQTDLYEPGGAKTTEESLTTGASGSGFIVNPDGYVVTNAHVVGVNKSPEEQLYARLAGKTQQSFRQTFEQDFDLSESELQEVVTVLTNKLTAYYDQKSSSRSVSTSVGVLSGTATPDEEFSANSWPATIETTGSVYDEVDGETTWGRDIAVLKVDVQHQLPTVRLGESTGLGSGAEVFVIGYPAIGTEALFTERNTTLEPSLTAGVVSARRTLKSGVETIQTDAAINSGNSGGPVYDSDGEVVGVATFGPADSGIEDTGFALPIETATGFLGELGVENEQSELSTTYQEGLNALWRDDCETVESKMNAVLDMWSDHPYADDIIDQC